MPPAGDRTLELTGDELRRLIDAAAARVVAHVDSLPRQPSADVEGGVALARSLVEPLPETGQPAEELLDFLFERVIPKSFNTAGPGYLAYIPGGGLPQSAVADLVSDATNRYVGVFAAAPGLAQLESNVVRWFCDLAGLPPEARGILTSGGSLATFSALVAARRRRLPENFLSGTIYVSDQTHHAVQKAAILAGFPEDRVREIPTDERFRIRLDALSSAIAADRASRLDAVSPRRQRRDDEHGRGRRSPGARGRRRARGALVPRRRRLRRVLPSDRERAGGSSPASSARTRSSSIRTRDSSCPTARGPPRSRRRDAEARARALGRVHALDAGGRGPDRLQPPLAGAVPRLSRAAHLAADPHARHRPLPAQPRGEAGARPVGRRAAARDPRDRDRGRAPALDPRIPQGPARSRTRPRSSARTAASSNASTRAGAST